MPGAKSQLAVPLRNKGQVIGALNLLSDKLGAFTERDEWILRQFGAHVAQAIATARLFESEREYAETLETLAEIGREMSAILDPDELLTRLAHLIKRVIDYRIFGIALLDEETQMLELKVTIKYGDDPRAIAPVKLGEGLVGYAALHKEVVLVPDVTKDPRYIDAVPGVRSELVVPLLLKDRCIGVFDLESPEPDAFNKKHVKLLTLLASEAAVAIENARLYESIRANEARFEKELRLAQRVQMALLPQELPKRLRGVDVALALRSGARARRRHLRLPRRPKPNTLVVVLGDVSGKGVPAALYGAAIGEMVRGRTFRRRLEKNVDDAGGAARRHEPHPPRAQPRGVLLHALLRDVRVQEADRDVREFRPAVPGEVRRTARPCRSTCRACRSDRSAARSTTTSRCRSRPATSSCCARTAFSKRSTRRGRNSAPSASST